MDLYVQLAKRTIGLYIRGGAGFITLRRMN